MSRLEEWRGPFFRGLGVREKGREERARGKGERKGREAVGDELSMFGEWGYGGYIVSLMVYGVGMD